VATPTDGDQEPVLAGELHGVDHVGSPRTPYFESGAALMHRVEDGIVLVPAISGRQNVSAGCHAELFERSIINPRFSSINSYKSRCHYFLLPAVCPVVRLCCRRRDA
jgi:hypothetical protein